jgi:hypothetical protein
MGAMKTATQETKMDTRIKAQLCGRCKGTGYARYNHMNGDVHCYLCNGSGIQVKLSAEEKARRAEQDTWSIDAHMRLVGGSGSFKNQIRRPIQEATNRVKWIRQSERDEMTADELAAYEAARDEGDRRERELERRITFWVGEGLADMQQSQGEERRAAEAAAVVAAKADPKMQAKLQKNWEAYIAAAPNDLEARTRTRLSEAVA